MTAKANPAEDNDLIGGLQNYKKDKAVEPLPSRPKDDADEERVGNITNLPEGYGKQRAAPRAPVTTTVFRARISTSTYEELIAHKSASVGLTHAAIMEEMWTLYKEKNKLEF